MNIRWSKTVPYLATAPVLIGQPDRGKFFVEIHEGTRTHFIVEKWRETEEGSERLVKTVTTNVWERGASDRGRELGMPGAGYAMEIGERLLRGRK